MDNLDQTYSKDYKSIERMFYQFKLAYQNRVLDINQFQTYFRTSAQISLVSHAFIKNFIQILPKKQTIKTLQRNQFLFSDFILKSKQLSKMCQQLQHQKYQLRSAYKIQNTCQKCNLNIRKVNTQQVRQYLENQYIGTLGRILQEARMEIKGELFTEQEDRMFFKQLHMTLKKKHQNIEFNSKTIQAMINTINREISQLTVMKKLAVQESKQVQSPDYLWIKNIQTTLNQLLQSSFKKKIPVFLQSMMSSFDTHFKAANFKQTVSQGSQTFDYESIQISQYKEKLLKLGSRNFKLENELKWFEQNISNKNSQITDLSKKCQMEKQEWHQNLMSEKQKNRKMENLQTTLNKQIIVVKDQINQKNQKQLWLRKKISKIQKQKLQVELKNFQKQPEVEQQTSNKSIQNIPFNQKDFQKFASSSEGFNGIRSNKDFQFLKKTKSKKVIQKIIMKQKKAKISGHQNTIGFIPQRIQIEQKQIYQMKNELEKYMKQNNQSIDQQDNKKQSIQRQRQQKIFENKQRQKREQFQLENNQNSNQNQDQNNFEQGCHDLLGDNESKNEQINSNIGSLNYEKQSSKITVLKSQGLQSSHYSEVRRVNQMMEQRLKQSGIIVIQRKSKRLQSLVKTDKRLPLNSQIKTNIQLRKDKSQNHIKSSNKYHFVSQTNIKGKGKHPNSKDKQLHRASVQQEYDQEPMKFDEYSAENSDQSKGIKIEVEKIIKNITKSLKFLQTHKKLDFKNEDLNQKINKLILILLQKHKKTFNNQSNDFQSILNYFQNQIQQLEQSNKNTGQQNTLFQRKANKSVSFFQQKFQKYQSQYHEADQQSNQCSSKNVFQQRISQQRKVLEHNTCIQTPCNEAKNQKSKVMRRSLQKMIQNSKTTDVSIKGKQLKYPKICHSRHHKRKSMDHYLHDTQKQNKQFFQLFTKDDLDLFIDENTAYLYECNHMKSYHKNLTIKITSTQEHMVSNMFQKIEQMKQTNKKFYDQVIAFIRYPYQCVKNNRWGAQIVKGMKYETLVSLIERISYLHKKCHIDNQTGFCAHLNCFNKKLELIKNQAKRIEMFQK